MGEPGVPPVVGLRPGRGGARARRAGVLGGRGRRGRRRGRDLPRWTVARRAPRAPRGRARVGGPRVGERLPRPGDRGRPHRRDVRRRDRAADGAGAPAAGAADGARGLLGDRRGVAPRELVGGDLPDLRRRARAVRRHGRGVPRPRPPRGCAAGGPRLRSPPRRDSGERGVPGAPTGRRGAGRARGGGGRDGRGGAARRGPRRRPGRLRPRPARAAAPARPEDGGGGLPRGRHRPRLQQHPHRDPQPRRGRRRVAAGGVPGPGRRRGDRRDGQAGGGADAADPGLRPQAGERPGRPRPQRDHRRRDEAPRAAHRRAHRREALARPGAAARPRRPAAARAGPHEPRGERPRRHGRRRHPGDLDLLPPAPRRRAARAGGGRRPRQRDRDGRRDPRARLRPVLHDEGSGPGHRPRPRGGARDRAAVRRHRLHRLGAGPGDRGPDRPPRGRRRGPGEAGRHAPDGLPAGRRPRRPARRGRGAGAARRGADPRARRLPRARRRRRRGRPADRGGDAADRPPPHRRGHARDERSAPRGSPAGGAAVAPGAVHERLLPRPAGVARAAPGGARPEALHAGGPRVARRRGDGGRPCSIVPLSPARQRGERSGEGGATRPAGGPRSAGARTA